MKAYRHIIITTAFIAVSFCQNIQTVGQTNQVLHSGKDTNDSALNISPGTIEKFQQKHFVSQSEGKSLSVMTIAKPLEVSDSQKEDYLLKTLERYKDAENLDESILNKFVILGFSEGIVEKALKRKLGTNEQMTTKKSSAARSYLRFGDLVNANFSFAEMETLLNRPLTSDERYSCKEFSVFKLMNSGKTMNLLHSTSTNNAAQTSKNQNPDSR
ncbi:MAG: hypothetical protein JWQ35_1288 [Bacteriovoracaceae bacterium]|nr:hypothetical protein [Bacteriovoracaceae bacterium]